MAKQANGAVINWLRRAGGAGHRLYRSGTRPNANFFLTVDYREYTYSAGASPAASSNAKAVPLKKGPDSRLIDRPIRPVPGSLGMRRR
jgi:polyribonucleotide nucleotidyltransferase